MISAPILRILLLIATSVFAGPDSTSGFRFNDHLPGYYAVITQTSTERAKINRKEAPLILSTDGLSGVKHGLYIGAEGAYLEKKDADSVLAATRRKKPDAYVKHLGNYSNQEGASFEKTCNNCWLFSQAGKTIRGRFLQKKGWLLQQDGAPDYLLKSGEEPAGDDLRIDLLASTGWLLRKDVEEECCINHFFQILSYSGKFQDELEITIGDTPDMETVELSLDAKGDPRIVRTSDGNPAETWKINRSKFVKQP